MTRWKFFFIPDSRTEQYCRCGCKRQTSFLLLHYSEANLEALLSKVKPQSIAVPHKPNRAKRLQRKGGVAFLADDFNGFLYITVLYYALHSRFDLLAEVDSSKNRHICLRSLSVDDILILFMAALPCSLTFLRQTTLTVSTEKTVRHLLLVIIKY